MITGLVILASLGGLFLILHFFLPRQIIKPKAVARSIAKDFPYPISHKTLITRDSISLDTAWIRPKENIGVTIIMIHGNGSSKEIYLEQAMWLAEIGVSTFLLDLRAHGRSGGKFTTFGFKEKADMRLVYDFIRKESPKERIGIWGHSMGAAVAIQFLKDQEDISFAILQSTFRNCREIINDYIRKSISYIPQVIIDYVIGRAEQMADFRVDEVDNLQSISNLDLPILFAHGTEDPLIKYDYGVQLYDKSRSTQKQFYPIEGGEHDGVYAHGGEAYIKVLKAFINKHI